MQLITVVNLVEHQFLYDGFAGWLESLEFDSGVRCGELPVDLPPLSVASRLPSCDFGLQCGPVGLRRLRPCRWRTPRSISAMLSQLTGLGVS